MIKVAVLLGKSALVGNPLFDLIGIHLGAFGMVGGIVLARTEHHSGLTPISLDFTLILH